MKNLHKLYYKDYYKDVKFALKKGEVISSGSVADMIGEAKSLSEQFKFKESDFFKELDFLEINDLYSPKDSQFRKRELEVLYPGLVTGVGIKHEAKVTGEFKLGMHFDYTTGLPIIYGSSVKGVLRSYFKDKYKGNADVDALIADIFEGGSYADRNTPLERRKSKPVYDRDVFFDAIVVSQKKAGKILESDALAPHGGDKHDNPFADPVPIPFLKIAPGVKLRFRFKLVPTYDATGEIVMPVDDKLGLFTDILTTFGIGAKTNVGYGQMEVVEDKSLIKTMTL